MAWEHGGVMTLGEADARLIFATDDIDEVVAHLRTHAIDAFQLRAQPIPKPSRLLGERRWRHEAQRSRTDPAIP